MGCCDSKAEELAVLREKQRRVLWVVLAINAVLFVVEFTVGWWSRSTALLADSLDMFGDAAIGGDSLDVEGSAVLSAGAVRDSSIVPDGPADVRTVPSSLTVNCAPFSGYGP